MLMTSRLYGYREWRQYPRVRNLFWFDIEIHHYCYILISYDYLNHKIVKNCLQLHTFHIYWRRSEQGGIAIVNESIFVGSESKVHVLDYKGHKMKKITGITGKLHYIHTCVDNRFVIINETHVLWIRLQWHSESVNSLISTCYIHWWKCKCFIHFRKWSHIVGCRNACCFVKR
jgi:hypothetical protein